MSAVLKIRTVVQPDGTIEVAAPELAPGQPVEVVVTSIEDHTKGRSALEILAQSPGHRLFKTAAEVDEYIRAERDSWGD